MPSQILKFFKPTIAVGLAIFVINIFRYQTMSYLGSTYIETPIEKLGVGIFNCICLLFILYLILKYRKNNNDTKIDPHHHLSNLLRIFWATLWLPSYFMPAVYSGMINHRWFIALGFGLIVLTYFYFKRIFILTKNRTSGEVHFKSLIKANIFSYIFMIIIALPILDSICKIFTTFPYESIIVSIIEIWGGSIVLTFLWVASFFPVTCAALFFLYEISRRIISTLGKLNIFLLQNYFF